MSDKNCVLQPARSFDGFYSHIITLLISRLLTIYSSSSSHVSAPGLTWHFSLSLSPHIFAHPPLMCFIVFPRLDDDSIVVTNGDYVTRWRHRQPRAIKEGAVVIVLSLLYWIARLRPVFDAAKKSIHLLKRICRFVNIPGWLLAVFDWVLYCAFLAWNLLKLKNEC